MHPFWYAKVVKYLTIYKALTLSLSNASHTKPKWPKGKLEKNIIMPILDTVWQFLIELTLP